MSGKPWTEEKRIKIAAAKAISKEKRLIEAPIIVKKAFNDPSMTSAEEVFTADELLERAARLERQKEAQVKKFNEQKTMVKDNAQTLTYTQKIVSINSPNPVSQPTQAKYATVAELVKDLESKKATPDQISAAIDTFTGGGMRFSNLADIEKLNPLRNLGSIPNGSKVQASLSEPAILEISEEKKYESTSLDLEYEPKLGKGSMKLLFPTMKQTNPATCWALVQTAKKFGERLNLDMESGDSMIVNSRNKLASRFLESGEEWSIWLDDDMIPQTGNANWFRYQTFCDTWADSTGFRKITDEALSVHFIDRLLSHRQKIVGATYFGRQPTGRPMFHEGIGTVEINRESRNYPNQLFATQWVGTGCLLVHRSVYLDMQKAYPQLAPTTLMPQWDFFRLIPDKGEDASFCDRAIKIGHQPYVDLGLHCAHVGNCAFGAWNTNNRQLGV